MAVCPNCGEDNPERAKFCLECGTTLKSQPAPPQEARKTVTVLFCDLVGSTALGERLDSESLREVMDRYFAEMKRIIERHGGIVEKYIGDAVMAVFGLPRAHEDDALRGVRATSEMRVALEQLNTELEREWGITLANRTGVNTGEVVVGDPSSGQRLATGDAVNVAARLEQAAPTGCVLVGEPTYRLVRDAVSVVAVEPLALKGKFDRLAAFRLADVRPEAEGVERRLDAPMVGRAEQLTELTSAFEIVVQENRCHLVTVLGDAGVGKSRLVAELAERLRPQASILKGRCLSYGKGITFWPLAEIVRKAADITDEDSPEAARRKVDDLLRKTEGGIAERVASSIGLSSRSFPIEESFWAARRLLEHLASDEPLVVIFEDIHWAEATLLDWIGHVADLAQGPILFICAARPELRDERPSWGQSSPRASFLDLQPLTGSESEVLIDNLLGVSGAIGEIRTRVTAAAQGNPLFVEQIISMWIDDGTLSRDNGSWRLGTHSTSIPPTISALLAARLDRLDQEERTVVAGASVVGQIFYRGAVEELCPPVVRPKVPESLSGLEAKQFIRPDLSTFADEQALAFRHVLIRDAAYAAILKRTRAELHERFASWLERVTGERISEYEEIVGYHLEQAYINFRALGRREDRVQGLGRRAARHLSSAGEHALAASDLGAAVNLLGRAIKLPTDNLMLKVKLGSALARWGKLREADSVFSEVVSAASAGQDIAVRLHGLLERELLRRVHASPAEELGAFRPLVEESIPAFEELRDDAGLAKAWRLMSNVEWTSAHYEASREMLERALTHARRSRDSFLTTEIAGELISVICFGPTPADEVIKRCNDMLQQTEERVVRATIYSALRLSYAQRGDFERARNLGQQAEAIARDLGQVVLLAMWTEEAALVELMAGNVEAAELLLRQGCEALVAMGDRAFLSTKAAELAQILCDLGRYEEAETYTTLSRENAAKWDAASQARWRYAQARILAWRGEVQAAEGLTRKSIEMSRDSDDLDMRGDVLMNCGQAFLLMKRHAEAATALTDAIRLYEQKGNIASAARASRLLEELKGEPAAVDS